MWSQMLQHVDPIFYGSRLARLPKLVVVSSDDEFMQFDWTSNWYDSMPGETRLLIAPNSEHTLATGIPDILECGTAFFRSIAHGTSRPSFSYTYDNQTGALSVSVPASSNVRKVVLKHAQTLVPGRSDFRWVRLASKNTRCASEPRHNYHARSTP